jgi:16S rRNA A1518/A1519 N6-dimethyltransferase RsmA/KsgA/DIM1 with predicted DNA glycosylase/AP lyase activity
MNYYCDVKLKFKISEKQFLPMPMVKSVVIIGKFKSVPSLFKDDEEKF